MKSDYELIIGAKAENSDDINKLYHQYIPLIYKHAHKLKMRTTDQKSDYAQDAFLRCLKAIKYVDLKKIINQETWKFYQIFDWFLQNLDKKYRKILYHRGAEISLSHIYEKEEDDKYSVLENILGYEDNEITRCEREESKEEFMKQLTPLQKNILHRRQNNQTIASIAKDLNVSYGTIHGNIYYAKKLAETIIL